MANQNFEATGESFPTFPFVDRRKSAEGEGAVGIERRQFANSHEGLSMPARELAQAIDEYKLHHRRRFISFEEMLFVIRQLGYEKRSR
jgi:hypothetical protein